MTHTLAYIFCSKCQQCLTIQEFQTRQEAALVASTHIISNTDRLIKVRGIYCILSMQKKVYTEEILCLVSVDATSMHSVYILAH